ncbi:MAG: zinc metallopeptidase [Clostridia bacterium]|nr:zinc metallopeptidase [Clostridia bacterium]
MNGYYYGIDSYYIFLVLPALLITLWAQLKVKSTFSKYSRSQTPITGADAARKVLEANGVTGVRIERVSGNLTDHYDPKDNVIRLSDSVYSAPSVAAVGVAAHEAGHAVQYAKGYSPIKLRNFIIPVSKLGSQLAMPLFIIGLIFNFYFLIKLGIIFFCAALFFQIVTLPVEFNASKRAMDTIKSAFILTDDSDIKGARSVLTAAAMTYVAALLLSLAQLLRLLAISNRRR